MDKDRIDYFVYAYESKSFSAAAAKVPMSSQGFTKAIRNLERDLKVTLFYVDNDGVRKPTAYADEYYQYAKQVQIEREKLQHSFDAIAYSDREELRIGCSLGILGIIGDLTMDFKAIRPDVKLIVSEASDSVIDLSLHEGVFDLALTMAPYPPDFVTVSLYSSPVYMWVHNNSPLSKKSKLEVEDIFDQRIAMPGREFKCYQKMTEHLLDKEREIQANIAEYSEIFWIYEFVLKQKGIGFTLPHLISLDTFSRDDTIKAILFDDMNWEFGISHLRNHRLTETEQDFILFVQKRIKRFISKCQIPAHAS